MDWDGVGTFALFIASGAVGVSITLLKAYKAKLQAGLERERLRAHRSGDSVELAEKVTALESQVGRLTDRLDFTERLLERGDAVPSSKEA